MQKAWIVQAQQRPDDRVVFVSRAGDGVEALIASLQFARRDIEQTARHLILKDLQRLSRRQAAARSQRIRLVKAMAGRSSGRQIVFEVVLYNFNTCDWG